MSVVSKVKAGIKKFIPKALKKRFGMAHKKRHHGHRR
jgi:hypothetical protein